MNDCSSISRNHSGNKINGMDTGTNDSGEVRHGVSLHVGFYDLILFFFSVSSLILTLESFD